ncbi:GA-like domain-containing protein [Aerococcaceae bacterium zg-1292]|uniref:GA-like domain-containing protein n=1 Tax=Aerococcaceae bacterium zg-1292 TaxID=2774330 RepID=UPI0019BE7CC5|nr:FIVAR domain-containing protein [Aerococcaceae bacterium zg-1292]
MFDKRKDRFSIRKFKVGVGSVFLGSFLLVAPQVYAEETANINAESENAAANLEASEPETTSPETAVAENTSPEATVESGEEKTDETQPAAVEKAASDEEKTADTEKPADESTDKSKEISTEDIKNETEVKDTNDTVKPVDKVEERAAETPETPENRPSALQSTAPQFELGAAEYEDKARLVVTKQNMVNHFIADGDAHGNDREPVTLTEDTHSQRGSLALMRKINMNESFTLKGRVNIGNKYEGKKIGNQAGGDGLAAVFTTAKPGTVGLSGASIGLGGIPNSFGFKLDTWHNTSAPDADQKAGPDPKYGPRRSWEKGAFGAFYKTDGNGKAITELRDAKSLETQPEDNEFRDYVVEYDGATKKMKVTYAGQVFEKDITDYLRASRLTTKQKPGEEYLTFALFASTGTGTNKHQFDLEKFEYSAGGSYVRVLHVDDATGDVIKETLLEGTTHDTADLTDKLNIDDYERVRTNASTAPGYQNETKIDFKSGIQTITYTYKKIVKDELKQLVEAAPGVKEGSAYGLAEEDKKGAYDAAVNEGQTVLDDKATTQEKVDDSIAKINKALDDLNLSAATKAVDAAVAAGKEGKQKRDSVLQQEEITEDDQKEVDALNKATEAKKEIAKALVEKVADAGEKQKLQDRLNNVKTESVDVKEKVDKEKLQKLVDESTVMKNSPEYQHADPAKKQAYDEAIDIARDSVLNNKVAKQQEVDQSVADIEKAIADLNLSAAENAVKAAEEAGEEGKQKRDSVLKQDKITEDDKKEVDALNKATEAKKKIAADLVNQVTDPVKKQELQGKLDKLKTQSVEVTPEKPVNKEKLQSLVDGADTIKKSKEYQLADEAVRAHYDDVLKVGEDTLKDGTADQTRVDNSAKGIEDAIKALEISAAKAAVKAAEEARDAGKAKVKDVKEDGLIKKEEKEDVDKLNKVTTDKKKAAQDLVNKVNDPVVKKELQDRLNNVTTEDVIENDTNNNGIPDDVDKAIQAAKDAIKEAEDAAAKGKDEVEKAKQDGLIKEEEKEDVDKLNKDTTDKKKAAQDLIDKVNDPAAKKELQKRLDEVQTQSVEVTPEPEVDKKELQKLVEGDADLKKSSAYTLADEAAQQVYDKAIEEGKKVLENTKADQGSVTDSIKNIKDAIAALNESAAKKEAEKDATAAVEEAEKANAEVEAKKKELEQKKAITEEDKQAVDKLIKTTNEKKTEAEDLVKNLSNEQVKDGLQARLDDIDPKSVEVNDKDKNNIPDNVDAAIKAVEEAEQADAAVTAKKKELERKGAITKADKEAVDQLIEKTQEKKVAAEKLVNDLPYDDDKKVLNERLKNIDPKSVEINDKNENGVPDNVDAAIKAAEAAVKAAEDAAKAGQAEKEAAEKDKVVTQAEKDKVDQLNKTTEKAKKDAEELVKQLPNGPEKEAFEKRLKEVTPADVEVTNPETPDPSAAEKAAEAAVKAAEDAAKAGQDKKAEVEKDGAVNPAEKAEVDNLNADTTAKKDTATPLVDNLPEGKVKEDLKKRLAAVKTATVTVNDQNSDGVPDSQAEANAAAEAAVKAAEDAAKAGQDKKAEVEKDGAVNPAEATEIAKLNEETTGKKSTAAPLVNSLPNGEFKDALLARLAKVNTVSVTVNDKNSDGIPDSQAEANAAAEAAVKAAEDAAKAGKAKKAEVEKDGAVNPAEATEIAKLNEETTGKKSTAAPLVNSLPNGEFKDALLARLAKVNTVSVTVNDKNSDGIPDSQAEANAAAEAAVKAAEDAAEAGQDKKAEVEKDGAVNPAEKAEVDKLNDDTTAKKDTATPLVDNLPEGKVKEDLKKRLAAVNTATVTVNDKNSDGVPDSQAEANAAAEAAVKAAEDAAEAGKDKKAEIEKDGIVNPAEKAELDKLNEDTAGKKSTAAPLVNSLPNGEFKDALLARLAKVKFATVTVNDKNSDGIPDDEAAAKAAAEAAVKAAEDAAKAGQAKKTEVEKDGVVNSAEAAEIDKLNADTTGKKSTAAPLVNSLPNGEFKDALLARLAKVNTVNVTVNDKNSDGIADDEAAAKAAAEAAVKAAEEAGQKGYAKKAEIEKDGVVNSAEAAEIDKLNADTTGKKSTAAPLVNSLPNGEFKDALLARLAKVNTVSVTVNDQDSNGRADSIDKAFADAESAVKAAEAAAKAGEAKKAEVEQDGVVTPTEKGAVDTLNIDTIAKKTTAETLVNNLPEGEAKAALKARLEKVTTVTVEVSKVRPDNGEKPNTPEQPKEDSDSEKPAEPEKSAPGQSGQSDSNVQKSSVLPNTGESNTMIPWSAAALSILVGLGLVATGRKKEDEEA